MLPTDVIASISLIRTVAGLHGYTVQAALGTHMAAHWHDPASALFAACDHATRVLNETGFAVVFRNDGREWTRIDLDCPPHADHIAWRRVEDAVAA